jgi:hypothetical protein
MDIAISGLSLRSQRFCWLKQTLGLVGDCHAAKKRQLAVNFSFAKTLLWSWVAIPLCSFP